MVANNNSLFNLIRQIIDMGLSDIEPQSVRWDGDHFSALNIDNKPRYGVLVLSNNLPFILKVSNKLDSSPLGMIKYIYPDPPTSCGGFPSRIIILYYSFGLEIASGIW
jgi:hypothetical protein